MWDKMLARLSDAWEQQRQFFNFMGDSNIIEVYIRYLHLKLEENNEKRLIQTVRGVGYSLRS